MSPSKLHWTRRSSDSLQQSRSTHSPYLQMEERDDEKAALVSPKGDVNEDVEVLSDKGRPARSDFGDDDKAPAKRPCCTSCTRFCTSPRTWPPEAWAAIILALVFVPMSVALLVMVITNYQWAPDPVTFDVWGDSNFFTHTMNNPGVPGEISPLPIEWDATNSSLGTGYMINYNGTGAKCCGTDPAKANPRVFYFGDPRKPLGFKDGSLACRVFSVPDDETLQIVGVDPLIDSHGGIEVVHHLDIYACDSGVDNLPDDYYGEGSRCVAINHASKNGPCYKLLFAYDRGAKSFRMPDGAGITIGKGTRITRLGLELHFLTPENWPSTPYAKAGVEDISGFRLHLVRGAALRPTSLGSMAFVNDDFLVPPSMGLWALQVLFTAAQMASLIGADMDASPNKGIQVVASHLHTHNYSVASFLDHMRGNKVLQRMRTHSTGGYGDVQTFEQLRGLKPIRRGDALRYTCIYNTSHLVHPLQPRRKPTGGLSESDLRNGVGYSLNAGGEMCAPLLLYQPTQHEIPILGTNYKAVVSHSGPWKGSLEELVRQEQEENKRMGISGH